MLEILDSKWKQLSKYLRGLISFCLSPISLPWWKVLSIGRWFRHFDMGVSSTIIVEIHVPAEDQPLWLWWFLDISSNITR